MPKSHTQPIKQTCQSCSTVVLPSSRFPYDHCPSSKYLCDSCQTEANKYKTAPIKNHPPKQNPSKLACAGCGKIPATYNELVDKLFPGHHAHIIMEYLTPGNNTQLVPYEECIKLPCKRRLCLECYNNLPPSEEGYALLFNACPCKKPHRFS